MKKGDISVSGNARSMKEKREKIIKILLIIVVSISILFSILNIANTAVKVHNLKINKFSPNVVRAQVSICFDVVPPEMDPIYNQTAQIGVPFTLKINATSPSNRTVYFFDNTTLFEINETTGWINFTPTINDSGYHLIRITATHNICDVNTTRDFWMSIAENNPPIWMNETPFYQNLTEDSLYNFNVSRWAYDVDNDTLTFSSNYSIQDFPNFNLTSNGLIHFTPDDEDVGMHYVLIYANDSVDVTPKLFIFNVVNVEEPPSIVPFPTQFNLCEHENFYYDVDAIDEDLNIPNTPEELFFYDNITLFVINEQTGEISFSPDLDNPEHTGRFPARIYVTDEIFMDYQDTAFLIVPINDAPVMEVIPAKTVWVNDTLDFYASTYDEEDGSNYEGNMNFTDNTTLFDIDDYGHIVYTGKQEDNGTTSYIQICALDNGITPPSNASLCDNDYEPKTTCREFSLTVTDVNRPPIITSYVPSRLVFDIYEGENVTFIITKYDPDGTTPTTYWFKNSVLVEVGQDTWIFETKIGDAGDYIIKAEITDGMLNDSVEWQVTVRAPPSIPGGAGGGGASCKGIWRCTDWTECTNFSRMFLNLTEKSRATWYAMFIKDCIKRNITSEACGLQIRTCVETTKCPNLENVPIDYMSCNLIPGPSCGDGIRNCHHGACELLIDCGGPCAPCMGEIYKEEKAGAVKACPDKKCSIDEIFTCWNDCYLFWIITFVSALAIAVAIYVIKRRFLSEEEQEKEKKGKHRKLI